MNKRTNLSHVLAAILSGLLLAAAFPKWDQTWLLIFALVPLLWALKDQSPKAAFWLGLVAGMAHYVAMLYWIVYVTHVFGHLPLIAAIGILFLLAGYLCLYSAVWGWGSPGAPPGASVCSGGGPSSGWPWRWGKPTSSAVSPGTRWATASTGTRCCSSLPISPGCMACRSWWSW